MISLLLWLLVLALGNVFPSLSTNDFADNGIAHTELDAELNLSNHSTCVSPANLANNRGSQFGLRETFGCGVPTFPNHILDIVALSSKKQMFRVYAPRVVSVRAVVKNTKPIWYGTMRQFPRDAMSQVWSRPSGDLTITVAVGAAHPKPATVCPPYLLPKPIGKRASTSKYFAVARTADIS